MTDQTPIAVLHPTIGLLSDEQIQAVRCASMDILSLAREVLHRAKPGGGFLADDHTLDNWRWAQSRPALIDRMRVDAWVRDGSKDMATRANERARQVLAAHDVPPLPEEAEQAIVEVLGKRGS